MRSLKVDLQIYWQDVEFSRIVNVLITYDTKHGLQAYLVVGAVDRQESCQVHQLLHLITTDFVECCYQAGVGTIVLGDVRGICRRMRM